MMSINFTGDPLSDDEIANYALELRRSQGLDDLEVPDLVAVLARGTLPTRFGMKRFELIVVADEELGGDEAHTLITQSSVRLRMTRTTFVRLKQLDRGARFTAGHELGHGVLHNNRAPLARSRQQNVQRVVAPFISVEHQANFFSSMYLVTDAMASCANSSDDLLRYLISDTAADIRWERESKRRNLPKIAAGLRALADELRNPARSPAISNPQTRVCPTCGMETLVFVGGRYECRGACMGMNGRFPDGDGPVF